MSGQPGQNARIKPASLDFLTIFNPALGVDEASQRDQIVFYYSEAGDDVQAEKDKGTAASQREAHEKQNERLRQVGLAQGLIEFARGFSNGKAVDSIETEKHRIVLSEIERGWWILASISLSCLPAHRPTSSTSQISAASPHVEYSSREVSPPTLLVQQLLCAHRVFLLHHSPSLSELYEKIPTGRFCRHLEKYWTSFAKRWDVLLHGNPAVDVYNGIKLAAGGELGIGVGEEEWGSGEREVLEGLIENTEGLEDLILARFDRPQESSIDMGEDISPDRLGWLGNRRYPGPADGILFSGGGQVSRRSLRTLYDWATSIYFSGDEAYGVKDSPTSSRSNHKRRSGLDIDNDNEGSHTTEASGDTQEFSRSGPASIHQDVPKPVISAVEESLNAATSQAEASRKLSVGSTSKEEQNIPATSDTWTKYLTLGYGTSWANPWKSEQKAEEKSAETRPRPTRQHSSNAKSDSGARPPFIRKRSSKDSRAEAGPERFDPRQDDLKMADANPNDGHYLIGLKGNLDASPAGLAEGQENETREWNTRLVLRTLFVEMAQADSDRSSDESENAGESDGTTIPRRQQAYSHVTKRLRVLVYVHRPFMFIMLFEPTTSTLSIPSFFQTLHNHLIPLHKPLLFSTSPDMVAQRLKAALPHQPPPPPDDAIYDLIYDPQNLTVHTSIPNIPLPGTLAAEGFSSSTTISASDQAWTRVEALNVHAQILTTYAETRRHTAFADKERTVKTNRGWWVLWLQMGKQPRHGEDDAFQEAFLVRRAQDQQRTSANANASSGQTSGGFGFARMMGLDSSPTVSDSGGSGPSKLAEGIGVDARKYVESLLTLNR